MLNLSLKKSIFLPFKYIAIAIIVNTLITSIVWTGIPVMAISVVVFLILFISIVISYFTKNYNNIFFIFLLGTSIPNDVFRYLIVIIVLLGLAMYQSRKKGYIDKEIIKIKNVFVILLIYLGFTSFVSIGTNSDVWSFVLYLITFMSYPICLFLLLRLSFSENNILFMQKALFTVILSHLVAVLLIPLTNGLPLSYYNGIGSLFDFLNNFGFHMVAEDNIWADAHTSALSSSNQLAMISVLFGVFGLCYAFFSGKKIYFLFSALAWYVYVLTDTKHTMFLVFLGLYFVLMLLRTKLRSKGLNILVFGGLFTVIVVVLFNLTLLSSSFSNIEKAYAREGENPKYELYLRSASLIKDNLLGAIIGQSPGTYGSRVSSARAGDVLAKKDIKLPEFIPNCISNNYKSTMTGLYNEDVLDRSKSGALENPFSSMVGIIMEMGFIGGFMFFLIVISIFGFCLKLLKFSSDPLWNAYSITTMFAIFYILGASIFDQYFEQPVAGMFFWSFIAILLLKYRSYKTEELKIREKIQPEIAMRSMLSLDKNLI